MRVLHKVVDTFLRRWIKQHNPFSHAQVGFQPGRSTLEQAAAVQTLMRLQRAPPALPLRRLLGHPKAFDSIPHAGLLRILRDIIQLFAAWVEAIRQLLLGATTTIFGTEIPITRSCPQGSPLSPLLCMCYLEDLVCFLLTQGPPADVQRPFSTMAEGVWLLVMLLLFADDIALLAIKIQTLQWLLDAVRAWTTARGLRLSIKAKAMVLARWPRTALNPAPLDAGLEQHMEWVPEYRYLGATFRMAPIGKPTKQQMPRLPLNAGGIAYQLLLLHELLKCPSGARFSCSRIVHVH